MPVIAALEPGYPRVPLLVPLSDSTHGAMLAIELAGPPVRRCQQHPARPGQPAAALPAGVTAGTLDDVGKPR